MHTTTALTFLLSTALLVAASPARAPTPIPYGVWDPTPTGYSDDCSSETPTATGYSLDNSSLESPTATGYDLDNSSLESPTATGYYYGVSSSETPTPTPSSNPLSYEDGVNVYTFDTPSCEMPGSGDNGYGATPVYPIRLTGSDFSNGGY